MKMVQRQQQAHAAAKQRRESHDSRGASCSREARSEMARDAIFFRL